MAIDREKLKTPTPGIPIQDAYRAEYGRWRARAETLVTCLCMGRNGAGVSFYAFEVSALPALPGDPLEERTAANGSTYRIQPARHKYDTARQAKIAALADEARLELVEQVNQIRDRQGKPPLAAENWPQVADAVMQAPDLLAWLVSQRLLPKPPANPVPAERARRAGITEEQRQANAEAVAADLKP